MFLMIADVLGEQDVLRRRNEELVLLCKEKSRKLLQTQELYDKVKRKAELGQIQRAASDAVDSTLLAGAHAAGVMMADHERGEQVTAFPAGVNQRFDYSSMNMSLPRSTSNQASDENQWARLPLARRGWYHQSLD